MLNSSENEYSKFATKKWYVIDSESKGCYSHHDPIKFLRKSRVCDHFDAYISVTGDITVTRTIAVAGDNLLQRKQPLTAAKQVAFKN